MKALSTRILGQTCPLSNVQRESWVHVALLLSTETFDGRDGGRFLQQTYFSVFIGASGGSCKIKNINVGKPSTSVIFLGKQI